MASELTVQTLRGPTSGANADTVLIPSGQTLDASAATLVPSADQIIQLKTVKPSAETTFSSASYTDASGFNVTITPKHTNSRIVIRIWAKTVLNNAAGSNQSAHDHRLMRGSTEITDGSWMNYYNMAWAPTDHYPPFTLSCIDEPNTTSAITYQLQGRLYGAANNSWRINNGNGGTADAVMEVMEIAQ